jgi:antitoxin component YwqK of YwqJK toxin-antitoxin module
MRTLQKISLLLILFSFLSCGRNIEPDEIVLNEMVVEKNGKYYYGDCEDHATEYYTGSNKYYHENGKVKGTFTIKNGIPEGQ